MNMKNEDFKKENIILGNKQKKNSDQDQFRRPLEQQDVTLFNKSNEFIQGSQTFIQETDMIDDKFTNSGKRNKFQGTQAIDMSSVSVASSIPFAAPEYETMLCAYESGMRKNAKI